MAQNTDSPDREPADESDDRMFTDSFAPRDERPDAAAADSDKDTDTDTDTDELGEIQDLLPKAGPIDGTAQLP
jgi:hypothetical protein